MYVKYSVCTYYVLHILFEISQKHCQSTIISYFKDFNFACLLNRAGWRLDFQVWVHIKVQKSDNINFKTRDFSPLIEWVLAGVYWLLAPKQKFNISAGHSEITLWIKYIVIISQIYQGLIKKNSIVPNQQKNTYLDGNWKFKSLMVSSDEYVKEKQS